MLAEDKEVIKMKMAQTLLSSYPVEVDIHSAEKNHTTSVPFYCPIIKTIYQSGVMVSLKDKGNNQNCNACSLKEDCSVEMACFSPIKINHRVDRVLIVRPQQGHHEWFRQNSTLIENLTSLVALNLSKALEINQLEEENESMRCEINKVFSNTNEPMLIVGNDGIIHNVSEGFFKANVLGEYSSLSRAMLIGTQLTQLISSKQWELIKSECIKHEKEFSITFTVPNQAKKKIYQARVKPVLLHGQPISFIIKILIQNKDKKKSDHQQRRLYTFKDIKGISSSIQYVVDVAKRIAPSDTTILLRGESGVGKEVFAQAIHQESTRKNGPFVAINCAAIPESLLESELFGYVKGAFTGAIEDKPGRFELANGGTIFLDEIGDMSLYLQAKLLRVVQERKIERVGDTRAISVDVRLIAATHRNLEELVANGLFREDLYYRLNVIPLTIPPLRERKEDIPILIEYFMKKLSKERDRTPKRLTAEVYEVLLEYDWPGNIRELQNVVHHLVELEIGDVVTIQSLPRYLYERYFHSQNRVADQRIQLADPKSERSEKEIIIQLLDKYGRHTQGKKKVAKALGISLATLYRRMQRLNVK